MRKFNSWRLHFLYDNVFNQPKKPGEYKVIAISLNDNVVKDVVYYDDDDGWQIANNFDVIVWREIKC